MLSPLEHQKEYMMKMTKLFIPLLFILSFSFQGNTNLIEGSSWQTYSESEWEQRLEFSKDSVIIYSTSLDTEELKTYCQKDSGKYIVKNDTLIIILFEMFATYKITDGKSEGERSPFFKTRKIQKLNERNKSKFLASSFYLDDGKNSFLKEAWENNGCGY